MKRFALGAMRVPTSFQRTLLLVALIAMPAHAVDTGRAGSIAGSAVQEVVESATPREPDLTLADEPLVRIGIVDGPLEYIFGDVTGAVRLEDGSIVVADGQSHTVRRYDAHGKHLWTSGREGDGPGEYKGLRLLWNCPGAAITVFDWVLDRITELDPDGNVVDTRALNAVGVRPYGQPACTADGRLVFTPWPEDRRDRAVGESYRWLVSLRYALGDSVTVLRPGIPGTVRTRYSEISDGPADWGRNMVYAAVETGVWYGTADDYELEHLDWTGRATRIARWAGPSLEVTRDRTDSYRDNYWLARYDDPDARRDFERESWPDIRDRLPERFPAYESLLALPNGGIWVKSHAWRAPGEELHLLDANGVWLRRLTLPSGAAVLHIGPDWVLLSQRDELDVPTVALYELVESVG